MDKTVTQMRKTGFEKSYHNIKMLFLSFVTALHKQMLPSLSQNTTGTRHILWGYSERLKLKKREIVHLTFNMSIDPTYRFITLHMSTFWTRKRGAVHTELKTSKRNTASVRIFSCRIKCASPAEVVCYPNPNCQTFQWPKHNSHRL